MSKSICPTRWSTHFHRISLYHFLLNYFLHSIVWFSCQSHHLSFHFLPLNWMPFSSKTVSSLPHVTFRFQVLLYSSLVSVNAFNQWIPFSTRYLFLLHLNQIISPTQICPVWCHRSCRGKTTLVFTDGAQTMVWIPAQQRASKNRSFGRKSWVKFRTCTHGLQEAWSSNWLMVRAAFSHNKENVKTWILQKC